MSPASAARTPPALAGMKRNSNHEARCKLFFEPGRHSAFWGDYPVSDEDARPSGWAGGPRALSCERLGQGSNPACLVQKLVTAFLLHAAAPRAQIQRPHERPRPSGRASSRLDGLPGHEAAKEQRVC